MDDFLLAVYLVLDFICLTAQPFILCVAGNILLESCTDLTNSVFHSAWYNQHNRYVTKLKIFQMRLDRPLIISIYGLVDLNLNTFVRVR